MYRNVTKNLEFTLYILTFTKEIIREQTLNLPAVAKQTTSPTHEEKKVKKELHLPMIVQ